MPATPPHQPNLFERYRPYRRRTELAFWVLVVLLQIGFSVAVAQLDLRQAGRAVPFWAVLTWELSSQLTILALIPAVFAFERRFPLAGGQWRRHWPWHVLGSVAFSLLHVAVMVGLRKGVYAVAGSRYQFGDGWLGWPYEYLKDVRTYGFILLGLLAYRLFMLRLQGEARVLDAPETPSAADAAPEAPSHRGEAPRAALPEPAAAAPPARPERFLVRKLRREFLIAASDIDWVQAQGNYVGLHVNGHDYLLRATLTDLLVQLDPARYARVHRSYAVHLDRIREIEPTDGGDARLHMRDGSQVPCSRRYRANLEAAGAAS